MAQINGTGKWIPYWNSNASDSRGESTEEVIDQNEPQKSRSLSPNIRQSVGFKPGSKSRQGSNSLKRLKSKPSTTSLASMTTGNWLGWSTKANNNKEEVHSEEYEDEDIRNQEDIDDLPEDNGDEIDDHVTNDHVTNDRKKGTSGWTFWNGGQNQTTEGNDNKAVNSGSLGKSKDLSLTNKILNSTPDILKMDDITNAKKESKLDKGNVENAQTTSQPQQQDGGVQDDAVLYKPHSNAKQFNKIDTHKNENLKENLIVPDWELCLPHQTSVAASYLPNNIFGNSSTTNQYATSRLDIKRLKLFISQLSNRLGMGSSLEEVETSGDENLNESSNTQNISEFDLLSERSYKLYGKSLAKLPQHKRACLPNYSKYYKTSGDDEPVKSNDSTNTDNGDNVNIDHDSEGNLLINQHHLSDKSSYDIVNQKAKPLKVIKKILIIGVHGFFPTRMIRPLIGSPKGTSLKFANEAEKSVIRYCLENNMISESDSKSISIQKIALEKEGKIFDRVNFFTDILIKWKQELNNADFIFVASHSQGCVVSIILLARLIELGILEDPNHKRIGILGMAGINNGPFYGADKSFFVKAYSAIEHDSLNELFEFSKFESEQSLTYVDSISTIIRANVKLCLIGSINDLLVPLYSAVASHVYHPNIYRACYIEHSTQTPAFIQKLVSLCCHLQNLGYFDNNVLKELSTFLAGPLSSGGHSKIYNDGKVYDLGLKFILDTDDIVIPPLAVNNRISREPIKNTILSYGSVDFSSPKITEVPISNIVYVKEFNIAKLSTNPYILPWCVRGMLYNIEKNWPNNNKLLSVESGDEVGKNGNDQINDLYDLFDNWKPESKVLKDLKYRLYGIRQSKL